MTRFSQIYLVPAELMSDNPRMRRRLAAVVGAPLSLLDHDLATAITRQLGVEVPWFNSYGWTEFFGQSELRDVLDTVTIAFNLLRSRHGNMRAAEWRDEVAQIFKEEGVRYRIDASAIVHFSVDERFELSRAAGLAGLSIEQFAGARKAFEASYEALAEQPPSTQRAVREMFEANEIVFRLKFPRAPRLAKGEITKWLSSGLSSKYAADQTSLRSAQRLAESYSEWVEAMHWYRHGQGKEEPVEPPIEVATLAVDQGASFLRWLITMEQQ